MAADSNASMAATIEVDAVGQIDHLVVPPGWLEREVERPLMMLWTRREFYPPEKPDVRLYIFYRGYPVSARSGEAFEGLLQGQPHELDDHEWWSLQEVVRDAAVEDAFERHRVRTVDWAGKRVLALDGHWLNTDEDTFAILINAADHGCHVQEILYVAPSDDYQYYLPDALNAMNSIKWKSAGATEIDALTEVDA